MPRNSRIPKAFSISSSLMAGFRRSRHPPILNWQMTFSRTVMSARFREIWNVRDRPRAVILCGRRPSMRSPSSQTSPLVGVIVRLMQLKAVVFPAPFGPMSAVILPASAVKLQPSTALMPPKCLLSPLTSSTSKPRFNHVECPPPQRGRAQLCVSEALLRMGHRSDAGELVRRVDELHFPAVPLRHQERLAVRQSPRVP